MTVGEDSMQTKNAKMQCFSVAAILFLLVDRLQFNGLPKLFGSSFS